MARPRALSINPSSAARCRRVSPLERGPVRRHNRPRTASLERLEEAWFELLSRGVRRAVRLPLDSCSIRQVAILAGFRWRNPDSGPRGSVGRCPKALASADPVERAHILQEIVDTNAEDLLAMRAVWRWMIERGPREYCG